MQPQSDFFIVHHRSMPRTYVAPPTGPHKEFALRFRKACQDAQLPTTLKKLAAVLDVAAPTIHDWRHGEKLPSAETMARIAEKTRCSYEWLATGRGSETPPPSRSVLDIARRIERVPPEVKDYIEAILGAAEQRYHIRPSFTPLPPQIYS